VVYTDLKERYRRIVKISNYLYRPSLGELILVCEDDDQFNNNYYHKIESLRNFPPKTIIEFSYEIRKDAPIWWAIKEVIEDESYPYKKKEYTGPPTATSKSPNSSNSIQFGN
jgi:hypothetical protein